VERSKRNGLLALTKKSQNNQRNVETNKILSPKKNLIFPKRFLVKEKLLFSESTKDQLKYNEQKEGKDCQMFVEKRDLKIKEDRRRNKKLSFILTNNQSKKLWKEPRFAKIRRTIKIIPA